MNAILHGMARSVCRRNAAFRTQFLRRSSFLADGLASFLRSVQNDDEETSVIAASVRKPWWQRARDGVVVGLRLLAQVEDRDQRRGGEAEAERHLLQRAGDGAGHRGVGASMSA